MTFRNDSNMDILQFKSYVKINVQNQAKGSDLEVVTSRELKYDLNLYQVYYQVIVQKILEKDIFFDSSKGIYKSMIGIQNTCVFSQSFV